MSRLANRATLGDLQGKRGYLMVSVKNSSFKTETINMFCDLVETHLNAGEVILVDKPYAETIVATEPAGPARERRLANLRKVADDRRRFIEAILVRRALAVPIRSFMDVEHEVAPTIRNEVRDAFVVDGPFRRSLLARSRAVIPGTIPDARLPRYAEFLLCEIPVLCHLYYASGMPGVVDVYPGENPQLFWDIERGRYADELPAISALVQRSPGLIYVDVSSKLGGRPTYSGRG